jgi:NAD(P)-dependent dehydrogenase (short-subunit alcohol dehydrogenase family)
VNAILPGLIDTPMAVDAVARTSGLTREAVAEARASRVPLKRQGTAWDVAHAALYLSSDEAAFVTGVLLPVDGGQCTMVG